MEVKINKEIRNYTESIFFGLSLRQCIFSALACIVAVIIYFSCINKVGTEVTSWLCMIGAAPFAALGFIKYQEMSAEQIFMTSLRSFLLSKRKLIFQPINLYYEILKNQIEAQKKEYKKKDDKKLRENKKKKQREI